MDHLISVFSIFRLVPWPRTCLRFVTNRNVLTAQIYVGSIFEWSLFDLPCRNRVIKKGFPPFIKRCDLKISDYSTIAYGLQKRKMAIYCSTSCHCRPSAGSFSNVGWILPFGTNNTEEFARLRSWDATKCVWSWTLISSTSFTRNTRGTCHVLYMSFCVCFQVLCIPCDPSFYAMVLQKNLSRSLHLYSQVATSYLFKNTRGLNTKANSLQYESTHRVS